MHFIFDGHSYYPLGVSRTLVHAIRTNTQKWYELSLNLFFHLLLMWSKICIINEVAF